MPESVWEWSTTASSNANADSQINWAEGMLPGGVNNSARSMMAALKKLIEDQGGKASTTGSSNTYALTTQADVNALADGVMISFVANHTNTGAATLAVDGLTAKAIRKGADVAVASGDIVSSGHYLAQYDASANSAAGAWLLLNPALPTPGTSTETFILSGDITPTQITSNQNNYAPTGLSTAAVLRLSTDASRNITGLTGGSDGRVLILYNVGSFPVVLKDEDALSTAANRFALVADVTLATDQTCILQYDSTTSRWRSLGASVTAATASEYRANTADKFLDTDGVWAAAEPVFITFATTMTPDLSAGIDFLIAATDNFTLNFPTNPKAGQKGVIKISHSGAGRTMTLQTSAGWHTPGGGQIALSTAASEADLLSYWARSTTEIHIFRAVLDSTAL